MGHRARTENLAPVENRNRFLGRTSRSLANAVTRLFRLALILRNGMKRNMYDLCNHVVTDMATRPRPETAQQDRVTESPSHASHLLQYEYKRQHRSRVVLEQNTGGEHLDLRARK